MLWPRQVVVEPHEREALSRYPKLQARLATFAEQDMRRCQASKELKNNIC